MRTPDEFAAMLDRCAHAAEGMGERLTDTYRVADLVRARDEAIRADERARCSIVHNTLDDDALLDELVRRGVLEVDEYAEPCDWRCDVVTYDYDECRHACRCSGPHAEHECVNGHTVAVGPDDAQPERTLRYVTAWQPDTRTPQQRSDDAIDELRRRLKGDA